METSHRIARTPTPTHTPQKLQINLGIPNLSGDATQAAQAIYSFHAEASNAGGQWSFRKATASASTLPLYMQNAPGAAALPGLQRQGSRAVAYASAPFRPADIFRRFELRFSRQGAGASFVLLEDGAPVLTALDPDLVTTVGVAERQGQGGAGIPGYAAVQPPAREGQGQGQGAQQSLVPLTVDAWGPPGHEGVWFVAAVRNVVMSLS